MTNQLRQVLVFSVFFVLSQSSQAQTVFKTQGGHVDFYATGKPSMLKIHGENSDLTGALTQNKGSCDGKFTTKLSAFSSGMSLRDRHLKNKIFEIDKYPEAELNFKSMSLKAGTTGTFSGTLKFHGTEKEVNGEVTPEISDKEIKFKTNFKILLTDYGIQPPEFAGMKIENEVRVEVQGTAKKQ